MKISANHIKIQALLNWIQEKLRHPLQEMNQRVKWNKELWKILIYGKRVSQICKKKAQKTCRENRT